MEIQTAGGGGEWSNPISVAYFKGVLEVPGFACAATKTLFG